MANLDMINSIRLLRNIGIFDSVTTGATIPLNRLTLVYAENGRGKTTLAAVLRSLATGDPISISERKRLAGQHLPHVVLDCTGGPPPATFENNAWNRSVPNVLIFDDFFVEQNVYSGLVVRPDQRQKLHELVLGPQGVALSRQLQEFATRIEIHNAELRTKSAAIPAAERGTLSIDDFSALPARDDIDEAIQAAERNLAALRQQQAIRDTPAFVPALLPEIDASAIESLLQASLATLDAAAAALVQDHFSQIGERAEAWIADGMARVYQTTDSESVCPFCAQHLSESTLFAHYRAYFSEEYESLKRRVADAVVAVNRQHGGDAQAAFERAVRVIVQRRQFWSQFSDIPEINVDTLAVARDWRAAREAVLSALGSKQNVPLDRLELPVPARSAIEAYEAHRQTIAQLAQDLQRLNNAIDVVKEQAATGDATAVAADLARLRATKARHTAATRALCEDYLAARAAKTKTEQARDRAKAALDQYRTSAFPGFQSTINLYLERFNAGFRLDSVTSTLTRGGPACTYNVLVNNTPIPVAGSPERPGEPTFRTTLSAGDRNTLALAFFFASLDQDPALSQKIIVVDDPISSLDEHRSLTTAQEVRRLSNRASQVIVLSHNKPFLCRLWEGTDSTVRAALMIGRDGTASALRIWDVTQDCITEHDRRHALLRDYRDNGTGDRRDVARAIRPVIEAFLRVAYPDHVPPGTLIGRFRGLCEGRLGTPQEVLGQNDVQEIRDLVEYANHFHHDTNPAWETESINDAELRGFVTRTLRFTRR